MTDERADAGRDALAHRYTAELAGRIELDWQRRWAEEGTFHTPNPSGELSAGFERVRGRPKLYVMDMFPYPSGSGLHVGHPLGYIGTDVYSRFKTMNGFNVLHPMGFDAFGLPAEQYAVQTGQHPRVTTEDNIANMRRQMERLGLGFDWRRSVATTDVAYYRWTQWIFLQLFNAFFDDVEQRARPIADLVAELDAGVRMPVTVPEWATASAAECRAEVDAMRLVYQDDALVNWCPALGTVLANEEVTSEGRSDRGNFPVFKVPLRQWKMRITAYADRLLTDLDVLDWPEPIKVMQRNWIGRSTGARVMFPVVGGGEIEVYTTRPDTLFGATFMVLAPEYDGLDRLVAPAWPAGTPAAWTGAAPAPAPAPAVTAYTAEVSGVRELDRLAATRAKTGVFTGSFAVNPVNDAPIPVFVADYVLAGYGTGAIMAVPGHDERDFEFARRFDLPIVSVVDPPADWFAGHGLAPSAEPVEWSESYDGPGRAANSENAEVSLNGLTTEEAKARIIAWLEGRGAGRGAVAYKLRDWLFSRQRYWGEPIPVVYDDAGNVYAVPDDQLPVELPELTNYEPEVSDDPENMTVPQPPLSRARDWVEVTLDLGDGARRYRRETNTMPQWAGSCWYYLRYLDPTNDRALVDPELERYWMGDADGSGKQAGGVDLYVGGVEHAVLHLLYSRFWHKVLSDLGHVSTPEPFQRLFNQGYVLAAAYTDSRGVHVPAAEVVETERGFEFEGEPVTREYGKMGKSLKNSVTPDEMYDAYGADTLRLYEMFAGPLDASRPWETRDVIGVHRFLQRVWRLMVDEATGERRVSEDPLDDESRRVLHRTIAAVREGMETLRFNTSIARLTELTTHLTQAYGSAPTPREGTEPLVRMLAPLAPHIAEELWARMGHDESVSRATFPVADPAWTRSERVTIVVQVKGKLRATLEMDAGATDAQIEAAARAHPKIAGYLAEGRWRAIIVPGRLVNFVPAKP